MTIPKATDKQLFDQEKNLYLVIQVPAKNTSTITILEGDYTYSWKSIISNRESNFIYYYKDFPNLSLLHFNSQHQYAFSYRLIEYLLLAVINPNELLDGNIEYVQSLLATSPDDFKLKGVWTEEISSRLLAARDLMMKNRFTRDATSHLDCDLEKYLIENLIRIRKEATDGN